MLKTCLKRFTCLKTCQKHIKNGLHVNQQITKKKKHTRHWCYAYVSETDSAHNGATKQFVY